MAAETKDICRINGCGAVKDDRCGFYCAESQT